MDRANPLDLTERERRTMTDPQRMIWRDDVEAICPSPEMCFEYGDHVRCGPCAIKQATACGVQTDHSVPNLPEVYRLRKEIAALQAWQPIGESPERDSLLTYHLRGEIEGEPGNVVEVIGAWDWLDGCWRVGRDGRGARIWATHWKGE